MPRYEMSDVQPAKKYLRYVPFLTGNVARVTSFGRSLPRTEGSKYDPIQTETTFSSQLLIGIINSDCLLVRQPATLIERRKLHNVRSPGRFDDNTYLW